MKRNPKILVFSTLASLALTVASHADTTFVTNTSGNAAALAGNGAGTTTPLTLSAADGGGTLNLTTVSVLQDNAESALGMDGTSVGVFNDKFGINNGNPQTWIFSFDTTLSFKGFTFADENGTGDTITISSSAWTSDTVTNGANWTFSGGTITTNGIPGTPTAYDFSGSGLSNIAAGTQITIAFGSGNGGAALHSFTVGTIAADTDPPTPDPMTWASVPAAVSDSSITMTATTASDTSGVEYFFTCTSGAGNDSGWQSSPTYTDEGLSPNTTYTYTVKARDAVGLYETAASDPESATTDAPDTAKPSPDPMTFAVVPTAAGSYSISMTATTATDASGVEYYFAETSGNLGGSDSGWQDSPEYTDNGLSPDTTYSYTVTARDKSANQNQTAASTPAAEATTDPEPVEPVLVGGFDGTNDVALQSPTMANTTVTLSSTTGAIANAGNFQSNSILWGTTDLDVDPVDTNSKAIVQFGSPFTLTLVVQNNNSLDLALDKIHFRVKKDVNNEGPNKVTITYTAGALGPAGVSTEVTIPNGVTGHDVSFGDFLADTTLATGEFAYFTWSPGPPENPAGNTGFRVDNFAVSGTLTISDYLSWGSGQNWTLGDPGTGEQEDYDGDGLSNDTERIFGLDPADSSSVTPFTSPFDPAAGTFSYTRRSPSLTGLTHQIFYSTDLDQWELDAGALQTPGALLNGVETVDVALTPALLDEPRLFVRVAAQLIVLGPSPELISLWGTGSTITLNFTEALNEGTATNTENYTVELDGGGSITVTGASLSENGKTVTLSLGSSLSLASAYNVTLGNVTGPNGEPLVGDSVGQFQTWDDDPNGIKVFILAGQSNMVGYGREGSGVDVKGTLRYLANNDASYPEYAYSTMLDTPSDPANSTWASRSDVRVWWLANTSGNDTLGTTNIRKGDLTVGFGKDGTMIGPEYAFGQVLGDFYGSNDVLIIKTAWGGKALASEFRPPSAVADRGGEVGFYYQAIIDQTRQALDNLDTEFPDWSGQGYQIVGIGWHQGFNDKVNPDFSAEYKDNLPDLISDLRGEFGKPDLPFAIASSGMTAAPVEAFPYSGYSLVEKAQLWVAGVAQPAETQSSDTRPFWEAVADSPMDQGYHWNQNARSYFRIGQALGDDMVDLLTP
ncbi:sialate O-acetylesterase [Haloferula sp. A504]|uniref:sialate O-acetylesterase n=1 Tax=Haloferula sp. A504 TaxID=3373601 RepID=UPI0031CB70FE|nr:hypothetical protein [Verrucomicrobiaceae bacterium E54]